MSEDSRRDEIAHALETVLKSETFSRSERARDLLRYLVEREQAGEADRLKGFAIGVDVFNKDSGFDPATDAVVRVQAGRLRQLLDQFYQDEAAPGLLRIDVPRGTYVPVYGEGVPKEDGQPASGLSFEGGEEDEQALATDGIHGALAQAVRPRPAAGFDVADALQRIETQQTTAIAKPLSRHFSFLWVAMGVVIGLLVLVTWTLRSFPERSIATESVASAEPVRRGHRGVTTNEFLPTVSVEASSDDKDVQRVASQFEAAIPAFSAVNFRSDIGLGKGAENQDAGSTSYLFRVSAGLRPEQVTVTLENLGRHQVIWTSHFPVSGDYSIIDAELADMLTATLADEGVIYADIAAHGLDENLTHCILLNSAYYKQQTDENHAAAYECFDRLRQAGGKSPLIYSELAILTMEAVTDKRPIPENASAEAAEAFARRAVDLGPQNAYAHRAMGFVLSKSGDPDGAVAWAKKAHDLNLNDLSLAASYGYVLTLTAGRYSDAIKVLEPAVRAATAHPSWWDYALFMDYLMTGEDRKAYLLADRLKASSYAHYKALRLIAAHGTGNKTLTESLLSDLRGSSSSFAGGPMAYYARAGYPEDLVKKLISELAKAGFTEAS
ncbi:hypothetical protein CSC94_09840 [Zhengella mangrovi]|uniref:Uncharacterized protein n=1 Tax=Zhengella mangrovi TaxID=1982044 RepID=A0A2G1QP99_9HYPH|nr:hypothetical protein [Zhengella mangrovi]PHP67332.1 hypothetical protein CSC94_09840 [Zhengella mangrovi]